MDTDIPSVALGAVLKKSSSLKSKETIKGYDFNDGLDYDALLQSYKHCGFQASNFGLAVEEVNKMIVCRHQNFEENGVDLMETDEFIRPKTNCTIFLGYTSNMVSAGLRETIRFLVQHKMVDCLVTSAGGIEEDLIKCLAPTVLGDFALKGSTLRENGLNRIGNLLVPNDNYCLFEDWVMPVLDELLEEQKTKVMIATKAGALSCIPFPTGVPATGVVWRALSHVHTQLKNIVWSPSKIITRLGEKIANPDSICFWAAENSIPIFSPALTDGSLGDMIYFHSYRNPGLVIDIAQDIRRINTVAVKAKNSGMIILGGGVVKHHINNSNLMRNGADYAVYINTGNEFDGSDSGARPDEAVSWGKIKTTASPVKVYADATLVFPLLVAQTFASHFHKRKSNDH